MTVAQHGNVAPKRRHMSELCCQVVEAKEAGAAGVIGVVANVLGNGSPIMTSFAAAIGLDAPLEVICDNVSWCSSDVHLST